MAKKPRYLLASRILTALRHDMLRPAVLSSHAPDAEQAPPPSARIGRAGEYRRDLDGLRAIAIILVLGFHGQIGLLRGGFVGVDVFLVISGFLITQDIVRRDARGDGDLLAFWARRVRRVFPALAVTIFGVFLLALLVLPPAELIALATMSGAAIRMESNIVLAAQQGYFADQSRFSPLLHSWSLGIEAGFYLLWPIFLRVVLTLPRRSLTVAAVVTVIALSLAASVHDLRSNPVLAFYLLRSRAWEPALGGLIVFLPTSRLDRVRWLAPAMTLTGIVLILAAGTIYSHVTPFPGFAALLPCAGAFLVIAAGAEPNRISAALSRRALTFVGRISYSLYLIHWPLLVLASAYWAEGLSLVPRLALIGLSFVLATLSYRFVEEPARRYPVNRRTLWIWAAVVLVCIGSVRCLTIATVHEAGFPQRGPAPVWRDASSVKPRCSRPPPVWCVAPRR